MLKKKCTSCAKKIDRKFNYCPYCGCSFKALKEERDFGMIGRGNDLDSLSEELKLPFGMGKIVGSLMKQLERELNDSSFGESGKMPRGLRIQVSTGKPQVRQVMENKPRRVEPLSSVSEEEAKRRLSLPRKEAESKVRRLADKIIYEISVPGVRSDKEVVITGLATGLEVRAYSKDKCYVKVIPLKVEVIGYRVKDEKVFVELKT